MATKDAAFMWETEALRSSPIPLGSSTPENRREEGWLTLRETERVTGIPISTLRKWVRRDAVPSFIDETEEGPIRMLWLQGVTQRAEILGREIEIPKREPEPEPELGEDLGVEIDLDREAHREARPPQQEAEAPPPVPEPAPPVEPAPGTMVVPVEAWDKMLMQLGNLHQAGQQLAEARERAAKAETEAKFLRERLSDLKAELATATTPPVPTPRAEPAVDSHRGRVSIEVEDGDTEPAIVVEEPAARPTETAAAEEQDEVVTSVADYSLAVIKHLYGTWRNRPRR